MENKYILLKLKQLHRKNVGDLKRQNKELKKQENFCKDLEIYGKVVKKQRIHF